MDLKRKEGVQIINKKIHDILNTDDSLSMSEKFVRL